MYPVSWVLYGDKGHAFCMHTLPEYRGNQLALFTCVNLLAQLEQVGIVPVGEKHQSIPAGHGVLGRIEKYIADSTCRDGITGECYY